MNGSIQSRLTLSLTAAAIALSAATGFLLYHFIGAEMIHNFDRGLQSNGRAVVSLVSLEPGGVLDFEFNEAVMPQYRHGPEAEYFQFRFADGKTYARSNSLGDVNLSFEDTGPSPSELFYNLKLPDGRRGRAIRIAFVPMSAQPQPAGAEPMVAVVARGRADLDVSLLHLFWILTSVGILLTVVTALTSMWVVRRSLRPLRSLAEQAATINVANLNAKLTERGIPGELAPIYGRLNDLLGRLDEAFTRERRFTSDVAHELRTPIAELRSIAEVAMKWPDDGAATQEALREAIEISKQMEMLVSTLLSLARSDRDLSQIELKSIHLASFVAHILTKLNASSSSQPVNISIPDSAMVLAEPTLFESVLTNLFTNAADYSIVGHPVRCHAEEVDGQWQLLIENQTADLSSEDVARMFEPFWRKDASRTGNSHAGLGLALVRAYCGVMQIEVAATLPAAKTLRICLKFTAVVP